MGDSGGSWRIQFEISPDEAGIGNDFDVIEPPRLTGFGLPDPDPLVAIAMRFQIAQKLHAVSDPHDPPDSINDRARDIVDLLLLRDLAEATGSPSIVEIRAAAIAVFQTRVDEAEHLGLASRSPTVVGYPHWIDDYARAAGAAGLVLSLEEAFADVTTWVHQIETA